MNTRSDSVEHIMLVDDDEALRIRVSMLLRKAGYRATSAACGDEALALLLGAERTPALILLDLVMPAMDGWRFREIQRTHSKLWHIPLVVLADAPMNEEYLGFFESDGHAATVLLKPFDCGDLMRAVTLKMERASRSLERSPVVPIQGFRTEIPVHPAP